MEILKKIGQWLAMGLFVGISFTIAMYGIGYLIMDFYADKATEKMNERFTELSQQSKDDPKAKREKRATEERIVTYSTNYKEFGPGSGLVISSHKERRATNNLEVLGVLENRGSDAWQAIQVEVELFDKAGVFVDECSAYITSTINPGESKNFKVSCGRCESNPLPAFNKYKVFIAAAHYKPTHNKPTP